MLNDVRDELNAVGCTMSKAHLTAKGVAGNREAYQAWVQKLNKEKLGRSRQEIGA